MQNSASEILASECDYKQPVSPWFIMLADYIWFVCLPLTPLFLPHNPVAVANVVGLLPRDSANEYELNILGISPLESDDDAAKHGATSAAARSPSPLSLIHI